MTDAHNANTSPCKQGSALSVAILAELNAPSAVHFKDGGQRNTLGTAQLDRVSIAALRLKMFQRLSLLDKRLALEQHTMSPYCTTSLTNI
jgi:hypothetical protein